MCNLCGVEDEKIKAYWKWRERAAAQEQDELQQIGQNPCGFCGLDGCFTSLPEKKPGIQSSLPSHQMLQFPPVICHALTSQYIILFGPCHSQGTHRPSGNIMLCII